MRNSSLGFEADGVEAIEVDATCKLSIVSGDSNNFPALSELEPPLRGATCLPPEEPEDEPAPLPPTATSLRHLICGLHHEEERMKGGSELVEC